MTHVIRALFVSLLIVGCAADTTDITVRTVDLRPSLETLAGEYQYIAGVRELSDGSIIVSDPIEKDIRWLNPATGDVRPVARRGPGPGEWSSATALWPLRGDTSLQIDPVARRWLLFARDSIFFELPPDNAARTAVSDLPLAVDVCRNLVVASRNRSLTEGANPIGLSDSATVMRIDASTGARTRLADLREAPGTVETRRDRSGVIRGMAVSRPAFAVGEQLTVSPEGWTVIARLDPLRIEWLSPGGGERIVSPSLAGRIRLTDARRAAYLDANKEAIASLERSPEPQRSVLLRRFRDFPEEIEPLAEYGLVASPDSRAFVRLVLEHPNDSVVRYLVVSKDSADHSELQLPPGGRIVAVTARRIYVSIRSRETELEELAWAQNPFPARREVAQGCTQ